MLTPMGLTRRSPLSASNLTELVCKYIQVLVREVQPLIYECENLPGIKKIHHIHPERHQGISQCLGRD